jgi:hypothetical protein
MYDSAIRNMAQMAEVVPDGAAGIEIKLPAH